MPELPPTLPQEPQARPIPVGDTLHDGQTTSNSADPNRTLGYTTEASTALPTIPGFILEAELGRGGMGVVYRARQVGLDRTVALKMILRADFASAEQKLRFQIEAENAARVQHPNIVQVYEIGEHQGQPFVALEFVEGGSLADWLNSHRASPTDAAQLVETLARAIHAAHVQGIIHRDLKPANILLASPGRESGESVPKITDFGLAKRLDTTNELTGSGAIMGTPSYMAPEQARGDTKHVGPAADQYALGVIFYQMLTRRLPFEAVSVPLLLQKISTEEAVPPRTRNSQVPLDLSVICLKCLDKDPAKRYATAEALAEDLKDWREHRPIQARPATRLERTVKWCRRYPAVAGLITVSLVAAWVASGLAWWALWEKGRADQQSLESGRNAQRAQQEATKEQKARALAEERLTHVNHANEVLIDVFRGLNPNDTEDTGLPLRAQLAEALQRAAAQLKGASTGEGFTAAKTQVHLAVCLQGLGFSKEATGLLEEAATVIEREFGPDDAATWLAKRHLAAAYSAQEQPARGLPLLHEVLARQQRLQGRDHPDALLLLAELALATRHAGRLAEALPLAKEAYLGCRDAYGAEHRHTLKAANGLALILREVGQRREANALFATTLQTMNQALRPDDHDRLAVLDNYGATCLQLGERETAAKALGEAWRLRRQKLGPDHQQTLQSMVGYAGAVVDDEEFSRCGSLFLEALQRAEQRLGPRHQLTLYFWHQLGHACLTKRRYAAAIPIFERVLAAARQEFGEVHDNTLVCMGSLAASYRGSGELAKALPMMEAVLAGLRTKHAADHPLCLIALFNLGVVSFEAGHFARAETLLHECLQMRLGSSEQRDSAETIQTYSHLAMAMYKQRKFAEAEPFFLEHVRACEQREAAQPRKWPGERIVAGWHLMMLYRDWGKPELVRVWMAKGLPPRPPAR